jgi:hypothetical protein
MMSHLNGCQDKQKKSLNYQGLRTDLGFYIFKLHQVKFDFFLLRYLDLIKKSMQLDHIR